MRPLIVSALLLAAIPFAAQERDFLTPAEVDQLREAQEIPARLQLYLKFAEQRLDRIDSAFKVDKAGRSILLHDLFEQFTKIVEAMDFVTEDAMKRGRALDSVSMVPDAEKKMLVRLEAYREAAPRDIARYQFVLDNAIDATRDSIEVNQQNFDERKREVLTRAEQETKLREAMTAKTGDAKEASKQAKEADTKQAKADGGKADDAKAPKKAPSLYRKGEKKDEKQ